MADAAGSSRAACPRHLGRVSVAVCVAGAIRSFDSSWPSIQQNIVDTAEADVYLVTSHEKTANYGVRRGGARVSPGDLDQLRETIGPSLRGAASFGDEEMAPTAIARWAGAFAANASAPATQVVYSWRYYLKRWACQALIADSAHGPYDVVVTMRPDLFVFQPWCFSHADHHHGDVQRRFWLTVGEDSPVEFGENEVLLHSFTFACANDWLAVSTFAASTTLEQMVHHLYTARAFAPCPGLVNHQVVCCERMMSAYLWRIGMARRLADLHVDMTRKLPVNASRRDQYEFPLNRPFEVAHRRVGNINNTRSRNTGNYRDWQWYCADPAFERFGDGHVAEKCTTDGSLGALAARAHGGGAAGANAMMCAANLSQTCGSSALRYPSCAASVDLRLPLPACVRPSLAQVVAASGYGAPFEWWRTCEGGACAPLPNAVRLSRNGTATRQCVFPGSPRRGGLCDTFYVER